MSGNGTYLNLSGLGFSQIDEFDIVQQLYGDVNRFIVNLIQETVEMDFVAGSIDKMIKCRKIYLKKNRK